MLERADSYEKVRDRFRWRIPARYNIGVDVCDRHAEAGAGTALIHIGTDGAVAEYTFADLKRLSNRLANVFAAAGLALGDRVGNFLRSQTGARSLAERQGTDPDAILSRAEARVAQGDVSGALSEIATLAPEGQAAMADWVAAAEARVSAIEAADALAAALGAG
jgi:acyl-CoA synthetase (AMP-forming)/AMP-acid ligase II